MIRVALLLALGAGCASAPLAPYLLDPEGQPHPACPPQVSIAAVGSSKKGYEEAAARARAAVTRRVGSSIHVETERILGISRRDGVVTTDRALRQAILERATFAHGELIAIVGEPGHRRGETYVLACLDRNAAAEALRRDHAAALQLFDAALARAREARSGGDRTAFIAAYREATRLSADALPALAQIRALAGADPWATSLETGWIGLLDAAAQVRAGTAFRIAWASSDLPAAATTQVAEVVRQALSRFGREARWEDACPAESEGEYQVRVRAEAGCRWGSLGHTCRPKLVLEGTDCRTGRSAFEVMLGGDRLAGSDPRDVERALRKALAQLTVEAAEPALREALATELP